ncbi:MAG: aminoglycoside phosphotransferase family protein [Acidimicrobiales bacterium]
MSLPPDHPVLAVVAPPRVARFRELLGLLPDDEIGADFTGWSKLVLLTADRAVLFPRDHTQVDALRREVLALEVIAELGVDLVPSVHAVLEDPSPSALPVVVLDRMPGVRLDSLVETMTPTALGDLFGDLGRQAARWHSIDPARAPELPRRNALEGLTTLADELELDAQETTVAKDALDRARGLEPVLVHGDLHEGQLLVGADPPHVLTGILDWQTARVDHPFVEFDLGEWGTAIWRAHRSEFPELRRRAWGAYALERGLPDELGLVFEWHHACSHVRKLLGRTFPVVHDEGIVGTLSEARAQVRTALHALAAG